MLGVPGYAEATLHPRLEGPPGDRFVPGEQPDLFLLGAENGHGFSCRMGIEYKIYHESDSFQEETLQFL